MYQASGIEKKKVRSPVHLYWIDKKTFKMLHMFVSFCEKKLINITILN